MRTNLRALLAEGINPLNFFDRDYKKVWGAMVYNYYIYCCVSRPYAAAVTAADISTHQHTSSHSLVWVRQWFMLQQGSRPCHNLHLWTVARFQGPMLREWTLCSSSSSS